jgi:hypothetical protein
MKSESIPYREPPPDDLAREVYEALFPPRRVYPPPKTLYDGLEPGMTDADPPVVTGLKLPPPMVLEKPRAADEVVPAFTRLWRVGLNDLMHLGWVNERLMRRNPHVPPHMWHGTLIAYATTDNSVFFQRSEHAVALARFVQDVFAPPFVEALFVLHQDQGPEGGSIKGSPGENDAIALVRAMRNWGKLKGAVEIRRLNDFNDVPPVRWMDTFKGTAGRREEVRIEIR